MKAACKHKEPKAHVKGSLGWDVFYGQSFVVIFHEMPPDPDSNIGIVSFVLQSKTQMTESVDG